MSWDHLISNLSITDAKTALKIVILKQMLDTGTKIEAASIANILNDINAISDGIFPPTLTVPESYTSATNAVIGNQNFTSSLSDVCLSTFSSNSIIYNTPVYMPLTKNTDQSLIIGPARRMSLTA